MPTVGEVRLETRYEPVQQRTRSRRQNKQISYQDEQQT